MTLAKAQDPIPALDMSFIHSEVWAMVSSRGVWRGRPKESEIYRETPLGFKVSDVNLWHI